MMRYVLDLAGLSCCAVADVASARVAILSRHDELEVQSTTRGAVAELAKRAHRGELRIVQSWLPTPDQFRFLLARP